MLLTSILMPCLLPLIVLVLLLVLPAELSMQSNASPCVDTLISEMNAKQAESQANRKDWKEQDSIFEAS